MNTNAAPNSGTSQTKQPDYETRQQLADRLSCSTRTIGNLMERGLPYFKPLGKLVRFPRHEVDQWLSTQIIKR